MARFRVIIGHAIPTDHIIDVEPLPRAFLEGLLKAPSQNWINREKPEYLIEFKSNQWDELQGYIGRYCQMPRVPQPACVVDTDDAERAKILPQNLKDEDVPKVVLALPESLLGAEKSAAPVVTSFVCPECDFEGKGKADVEAHMAEKHGTDVNQRSLEGKETSRTKQGILYACHECDFETSDKTDLKAHQSVHAKPESKEIPAFRCDAEGCEFEAESSAKLRGHKMGAHRKAKVAVEA